MRRQNSLWFVKKRQDILSNVIVLEVKPSIDKMLIYIFNIYNLLIRSERAGNSAEIMIRAIGFLRKQVLIIGNVNLYHTDWDKCTIKPNAQAKRFAEWVTNNNAVYKLKLCIVIYKYGKTLNLIIFSNLVLGKITESYVESTLHITNDYKIILTYFILKIKKLKR